MITFRAQDAPGVRRADLPAVARVARTAPGRAAGRHSERGEGPADQGRQEGAGGACKRLDLPGYSQRSLRRMFITRAIEKGVDVKVVAQWQGHRDGGKLILDTYSHVAPQHSARMAKLMSEELEP